MVDGAGIVQEGRYDVCVGHLRATVAFQAGRIGTNIVKCIARTLQKYRPPVKIFNRSMKSFCVMVRFCRTVIPYARTTTKAEIKGVVDCFLKLIYIFTTLGFWEYYHMGDSLPEGSIDKSTLLKKFYPEVLNCTNTIEHLDFQMTADIAVGILRFMYEKII